MASPTARGGLAGAAGLLLLVGALPAATAGQATPTDGSMPAGDRPSVDGRVREADLWHDSRDDLFRTPSGAVPAGTPVTLRLRAAAGDLETAQLRVTDRLDGRSWVLPMSPHASDPDGGDDGYDYWATTLDTGSRPTILDYAIVAADGPAVRHLSDDRRLDGGAGQVGREALPDQGWQITVYDPGFATPDWAPGSVVYQVFPDRFANADPANDPSPEATPGPSGAERFRHGDVYGNPVLPRAWDERPEGYCRAYQGVPCDEEPLGRDFFGGDLAGLTAALDDLADLGVTVVYLNPIFAAPSNHRYDTSDYFSIDPDLGTLAEFDRLIAAARERGIRIVLDGVFNHVSSDSPWFDRLARYEEVGACESVDSPARDWFTFRAPGPDEPSPCAPTEPGGEDSYYVGWFGFDTIPELVENEAVTDLVTGPGGVVRHWLERGIGGWRLDVADSMSPAFQAAIREAAKSVDPEAIVIAEQWGDSSPWLLGDQADSTMNYRFRRAAVGLVNGETADPDGSIEGLSPSGFASAMLGVKEDYPPPAWQALLNLVDSHDTARILWTLTPGPDDDESKSHPAALAIGKQKLRILSTIQLTFPGMAAIYYGDEVGLSGHDDPDDRRPYPWGAEDLELRDHYRTLARLRAGHDALREGDLEFLMADDATRTLAYLRRSPAAAAVVALNLGDRPRDLEIDTSGGRLPDGLLLTDALGGLDPVDTAEGRLRVSLAPMSAAVLVSGEDADLVAPPAPGTLAAEAGSGVVRLSWSSVPEAAGYRLLRSLVTGGGYDPVADLPASRTSYQDTSVHDGVAYHYVVTALDEVGNVSGHSAEAVARPQVGLSGVALLGLVGPDGEIAPAGEVTLSAIDGTVEVVAEVRSDDAAPERLADGIRVEVGLGPAGSDPGSDADWAWTRADEVAVSADGVTARGRLRPEATGDWSVGARASTDGGVSWQLASATADLAAVAGEDTTAPPAPAPPELLDVSGERVRIRWAPSDAPDLYRYLVLRGASMDGPFEVLAATTDPVYSDTTVVGGEPYAYAVAAQDTSFNTSPPSEALDLQATERMVEVTFMVAVPPHTTPTDGLFIAGDFQGWDPAGTPMTRLDESTWSISLPFEDRAELQYKYTRGSWDAVEKDAGCGELANRTLTVEYGAGGAQEVRDEVARWRDLDACG